MLEKIAPVHGTNASSDGSVEKTVDQVYGALTCERVRGTSTSSEVSCTGTGSDESCGKSADGVCGAHACDKVHCTSTSNDFQNGDRANGAKSRKQKTSQDALVHPTPAHCSMAASTNEVDLDAMGTNFDIAGLGDLTETQLEVVAQKSWQLFRKQCRRNELRRH